MEPMVIERATEQALATGGEPGPSATGTCVHAASLQFRLRRRDLVGVPRAPHPATIGVASCERYWTEWAEAVRAAVARQGGAA